jgi:hypothetical protein
LHLLIQSAYLVVIHDQMLLNRIPLIGVHGGLWRDPGHGFFKLGVEQFSKFTK